MVPVVERSRERSARESIDGCCVVDLGGGCRAHDHERRARNGAGARRYGRKHIVAKACARDSGEVSDCKRARHGLAAGICQTVGARTLIYRR